MTRRSNIQILHSPWLLLLIALNAAPWLAAQDIAPQSAQTTQASPLNQIGLSGNQNRAPQMRERAAQLIKEAERLWWYWAFVPAMEKLEAALKISEQLSDLKLLALCINLMGNISDGQGDYRLGQERHQRALDLARSIDDRRAEAHILASMGFGYWKQAEYTKALDHCQRALAIQEEIGYQAGQAITLDYIGVVRFSQGIYDQADEVYQRALRIYDELGDPIGQSAIFNHLGDVYRQRGAYIQALEYYERGFHIRKEIRDEIGQVEMLNTIGYTYMLQGSYREALGRYRRALHLAQKVNDRSGCAAALYRIGLTYKSQAAYARALACFKRVLNIRQELGDPQAQASVFGAIGNIYYDQGDYTQALTYYQRTVRIREEIQDRRTLVYTHNTIGNAYYNLSDYKKALEHYHLSLNLLEELKLPFLSETLGNIGKVYARLGDKLEALRYGQRAVESVGRIANLEHQWLAVHTLGCIQRQLGLREEALESFRNSLAIIERLRATVGPTDGAKAGFLDKTQKVYADAIALLMELGQTTEALEVAERARARAFLDLLGGRELEAKSTDAKKLAHIHQLQEELRQRPAAKSSPKSADQGIAMRGDDLVKAELSKLQLERPELASLFTVQSPTLAQLKSEARRRRATLVEYFISDEQLFIWVVEPNGSIQATSSKITRRELDQLVQEMRRAIQTDLIARDWEKKGFGAQEQRDAGAIEKVRGTKNNDYRSTLRRLYRVLIEPIEKWLPEDSHQLVTIIPHGSLFLVSFAAVLDPRGLYLVERFTINYSPAISVLQYTESKKQRVIHREVPQLLIVGNPSMPRLPGQTKLPPLPGAQIEAQAIAKLFATNQVTTLVGEQAEERLVRELALGQTMIHLATHGIIRDDEPLESLLALAPQGVGRLPTLSRLSASTERQRDTPTIQRQARPAMSDGLLTVREVFQLDLNADLVVLSACSTGLGKINGDGVIGLSRAFIYAGTPSVVVSLWRVADISARYEMEQFYRALKSNGGNKAAALRQAQIDTLRMLRQNRLRTFSGGPLREHPVFWAPFTLIGEAH